MLHRARTKVALVKGLNQCLSPLGLNVSRKAVSRLTSECLACRDRDLERSYLQARYSTEENVGSQMTCLSLTLMNVQILLLCSKVLRMIREMATKVDHLTLIVLMILTLALAAARFPLIVLRHHWCFSTPKM